MTTEYHMPKPCHESWDAMTPVEKGRHCAICDTKVWDLTAISDDEAGEILAQAWNRGEKVCARIAGSQRKRTRFARLHRHVLTNGLAFLLGATRHRKMIWSRVGGLVRTC